MAVNEYHFITHWRVRGTPEEVWEIVADPLSLPRWWPAVYLAVVERPEGFYELHTRGRLPYTLRWSFRVTESARPDTLQLTAWGDFDGHGAWRFFKAGEYTQIEYDWRIVANKPLLRRLSFLLKPVFGANHHWAMARGEESLKKELERRRNR